MVDWLKKYPPDSIIRRAYQLACRAHEKEHRKDGKPYITHVLAVAKLTDGLGLDENSVAAALLHDTIENSGITLDNVKEKFGEETAFLVDGLTKLKKINPLKNPTEIQAENMRKFLIAISGDLRVVLIKMMDRLDNMQSLQNLSPEQQKRISWETMEIYAPLAYRLGMQKLSGELEDLAFPYLYPLEYHWLLKEIKEKYKERVEYIEKIKPTVEQILNQHNLYPIEIDARAKRYASLYKKLLRYDMDISKIYDLVALRIVVKTIDECYAVLGVIHSQWPPLPGRFKDYIARPKPNGYKSLHTTVFCVDNKITEFQIKTEEIHRENELGIAAWWVYHRLKDQSKSIKNWDLFAQPQELRWVEQLRQWQTNFEKPTDFLESLKADFFKDRIFVLTPENEIIDLPDGSTPIDFAYRIHTDIGNQCIGAKANNKIVPLEYQLRSGDIIEIIIQPNKKPSPRWLEFVKTSKAKEQIREATKGKILKQKTSVLCLKIKIISDNRPNYLKTIANLFVKRKINLFRFNSQTDHQKFLTTTVIECEPMPQAKIQKIIFEIKKISGTKEIGYKFEKQSF